MRLLKRGHQGGFGLVEILPGHEIPQYAILSHTWGPEEVTFADLMTGAGAGKSGYRKIQFCSEQAGRDGLHYFWVDTCCIDKSSSAELQESINSMFRWYRDAGKCYVYLADVPSCDPDPNDGAGLSSNPPWESDFRQSRWNTRGWTLQELIAPKVVEFFSRDGVYLGTKQTLERQLCEITGIPAGALRGSIPLSNFTVAEKMAWKQGRCTTREEDMAYSLLGIFGVQIPLIYGEGKENALRRLGEEIEKALKGVQHENFSIPFSLSDIAEAELFVAREAELAEIDQALCSDGSRRVVVLHGLGGIGKTQLAVEYAKRHKENYSAIFWINIKDEDSLRQSFFKMAKHIVRHHPSGIRLSSIDLGNDFEEVADAVRGWLSLPNNSRWLIVYDNYDNPKLPDAQDLEAVDIRNYFPESYHGSIIITTRSSQVQIGHTIRIEKLRNQRECLEIISRVATRANLLDDSHIIQLAKELDGLPLALATAGAYLRRTTTSPERYLSLYKKSWAKLIQTTPHLSSYDRKLYSTWQISLDQVQVRNADAANLLRFWAYFDNEDIWFELLRYKDPGNPDGPTWLGELTEDELDFQDAMGVLHDYGLVEASVSTYEQVESTGYSIHSCVHSWTIHILNQEWDPRLESLAITCVASHVPEENSLQWATNRRLLRHATKCYNTTSSKGVEKSGLGWALCEIGSLFQRQDKLREAREMYRRALQEQEKTLGLNHQSTLTTVNNLGLLYYDQREWKDADALLQRAFSGREKTLGPEHASTLSSINNLGLLYTRQGRFEEAGAMYQRALQGCEKTLSPDHTLTLTTLNNLGGLYTSQGKLEDAEAMFQRALEGQEKILGPEHVNTLITCRNLGQLYCDQGKLEKAEAMLPQTLQGCENTFGPDHTLTLAAANSLGCVYYRQGRLEKAEPMYRQALQGQARVLGLEHMETLTTMDNLGQLYLGQGKLGEAESMLRSTLQGYEKLVKPDALGRIYPPFLEILEALGILHEKLGNGSQARLFYERAQEGMLVSFGPTSEKYLGVSEKLRRLSSSRPEPGRQTAESNKRGRARKFWSKAKTVIRGGRKET